jgi:tripartite-type tricarboxylate transporter receptor subunit TctC
MKNCTRRSVALISTCVALSASDCAWPQGYPAKPVRIVTGAPPAGGGDVIGRAMAQKISESTGQQFVMDNRPGAGSVIAAQIVVTSPPDGYTIFQASASGFSISPFLLKKQPYDPVMDFSPVSLLAKAPLMLTVHPSLPIRSVKDLITLARARPGEVLYASNGQGSFSHLTTEMFSRAAGIAMTHVPYKGGTPAVMDTVSGQVQLVITAVPTLLPQVRASRLRAIAVTSGDRSSAVPDVPTVAESGVGGFESVQWYGYFVPRNTPSAIVDKLQLEIRKAVEAPSVKSPLQHEGAEPTALAGEALSTFLRADIARWQKAIHDAKLVLK